MIIYILFSNTLLFKQKKNSTKQKDSLTEKDHDSHISTDDSDKFKDSEIALAQVCLYVYFEFDNFER